MKIVFKILDKRSLVGMLLKFTFRSIILLAFTACEDFVEVDPPETSLVNETVFEDDVNASAAMAGIYSRMVESLASTFTGDQSVTFFGSLSSDELLNYSSLDIYVQFGDNELLDNNGFIQGLWNSLYQFVYSSNSIIEGIENSTGITDSLATQFIGEAKFVRAWCYFYLTNYWGDVPLALSTDYEANALLPRVPQTQVYDQIVRDLLDARDLLDDDYSSDLRIRPNKAVVNTLLARVYLYMENWSGAESTATILIDDGRYVLEPNLDDVFQVGSQEAIWQLQSVRPGVATLEGVAYILTRAPRSSGVSLRPEFFNSFEVDDLRQSSWIGSLTSGSSTFYYPFKYKQRFLGENEMPNEYLSVFRLAEIYLIRAEARAQQNNIDGAREDINAIRLRAGLTGTTASSQADLLAAILQERKVELFTEWGHRWLDLKRTGEATTALGPLKPGWQETDRLWPVPINEFLNNPNLGDQNEGY